MQLMTAVKLIMGFLGFGIWTFAAYYDESLRGDYMHFVTGIVVGMAALALRDMPSPAPKQVDALVVETKQEPQQ